MGTVHPIWNTLTDTSKDLHGALTKAKLLSGTYMLQTNCVKFGLETSDVCPRYVELNQGTYQISSTIDHN